MHSSPTEDVKKIRLFRNGDENFYGKELVLNRRQIRTFDKFLQTVTNHVELGQAARSVRTPRHGSVIQSLDDLEDRKDYVAVGYGRFRNLGYSSLEGRQIQRMKETKRRREEFLRLVEHSRLKVPGRIQKTATDVMPINVFRNGDELEPAKRVVLTRRMLQSWELILAEVNEHVSPDFTATRQLYRLDGIPIRHRTELRAGGQYVAVGFGHYFKRLDYGLRSKPLFNYSPRVIHRNVDEELAATRHDRSRLPPLDDHPSADSLNLPPLRSQSDPVTINQKIKSRYSRNLKVVYVDGRTVFPSKPVRLSRLQHQPAAVVDYDRDEGGMFKATSRRSETDNAREINESKETKTDLPIDFVRAEQVQEERNHHAPEKKRHEAEKGQRTPTIKYEKRHRQTVDDAGKKGSDVENGFRMLTVDTVDHSGRSKDEVERASSSRSNDDVEVNARPNDEVEVDHSGRSKDGVRRNEYVMRRSDEMVDGRMEASNSFQVESEEGDDQVTNRLAPETQSDLRHRSANVKTVASEMNGHYVDGEDDEKEASTKIQAAYRGYRKRRQLKYQ